MNKPLLFLLTAFIGTFYIGGTKAWDTTYDESFQYACGSGQVLYRLFSQHNNYKEDRQWNFGCRKAPGSANITSCYWTGYVNDWDEPKAFQCDADYVVTGISSYHNNRKEDRRYQFKCCKDNRFVTSSCYLTPYLNDYDEVLDFLVPSEKVLTGVNSVHSNRQE